MLCYWYPIEINDWYRELSFWIHGLRGHFTFSVIRCYFLVNIYCHTHLWWNLKLINYAVKTVPLLFVSTTTRLHYNSYPLLFVPTQFVSLLFASNNLFPLLFVSTTIRLHTIRLQQFISTTIRLNDNSTPFVSTTIRINYSSIIHISLY